MDQFAGRLKALRVSNGFSQDRLAKLAGVAQAYIAELERGKKRPSVDVLERLCDSLGGSADYLLGVSPGLAPPCPLSPAFLAEIGGSGVTEDELRFALKVARLMRERPQKA